MGRKKNEDALNRKKMGKSDTEKEGMNP